MKILLVNDYGTPTAGAERITRDLRDSLRARGHTVRIFSSRAQLIAGESMADATCFGTTSRVQTLSSTLNFSAAWALQHELQTFDPDVVQVHMFLWQISPTILYLLKDRPSIYYVVTFKPVCPTGLKWLPSGAPCHVRAGIACLRNQCITVPRFAPLMLQRYLWRAQRHNFSALVACSSAVRTSLEAEDIVVRDVIWPGTPETSARPALDGAPVVTFTGRLVREKGVDILVHAFQQVHANLPDAQLQIAGSGPEHAALVALVTQLGLSDCVTFHGQLNDPALQALLARSWAHVVPSRWPEPFGMTCTEAMMRGTAVVASNVGGLADIVVSGVTGLHVPPGDASALAASLLTILSNPVLAEAMGKDARTRALSLFSLDHCTRRFEALYSELMSPMQREHVSEFALP